MDTFEALNKLREGSLIRKKGWLKKEFIYLNNGLVFDCRHKLHNLELPTSLINSYIWEEFTDRVEWKFHIGQVIYSNYAYSNINYEKFIVKKIDHKYGNDYICVYDDNNNYFNLFKNIYMNYEFNILT